MSFSLNFAGPASEVNNPDVLKHEVPLDASARHAEFVAALQDSLRHLVTIFGGDVSVSASGHLGPAPAPGDFLSVSLSYTAPPAQEVAPPPVPAATSEPPAPSALPPEGAPATEPTSPDPAWQEAPEPSVDPTPVPAQEASSEPESPGSQEAPTESAGPTETVVMGQQSTTIETTPDPAEHRQQVDSETYAPSAPYSDPPAPEAPSEAPGA